MTPSAVIWNIDYLIACILNKNKKKTENDIKKAIAEEVSKYPFLFDLSNKDYSNKQMQSTAWNEMSNFVDLDAKECVKYSDRLKLSVQISLFFSFFFQFWIWVQKQFFWIPKIYNPNSRCLNLKIMFCLIHIIYIYYENELIFFSFGIQQQWHDKNNNKLQWEFQNQL